MMPTQTTRLAKIFINASFMYSHLKIVLTVVLLIHPLVIHAISPQEIEFQVDKFVFEGELPIEMDSINQLIDEAQGHKHNLESLQQLAVAIEQLIRNEGYTFYRIIIPPQQLTSGSVTLKVISFPLAEVKVTGNHYFDNTNIRSSLPALLSEDNLNIHELTENLRVANQHPDRKLKLTFKQSQIADKVDAVIQVADDQPYHISFIMNNAGTKKTGNFRMTAAIQYSNLWNSDHTLSASYTTSPDHIETVQQYGFNYTLPIYSLKSSLTAYYLYSDVNTGTTSEGINVSGSGEMAGIHYLQHLPSLGQFQHSLDIGLDNRYFDNTVTFGGADLVPDVRSMPYSILYKLMYPLGLARFNMYGQWLANSGLGDNNTSKAYANTRFGASKYWDIFRYGASIEGSFHQWVFTTKLTGQHSDEPLISGEQIGLGGSYSVRGYRERETSSDSGHILNTEVYTPEWKGVKLLGFFDYGYGTKQKVLPGETASWTVSSLGAGIRWQWKKNVLISLDYAYPLNTSPETRAGDGRIHGRLVLQY